MSLSLIILHVILRQGHITVLFFWFWYNPCGKRLTAEGVLSLPFTLFLKSLTKLWAFFHGLSCKTRVCLVESSRWPIIHLLQVLPASCCSFEKLIPSCNFVAQPLNIPPFYSSKSNLTSRPSFDIRPEHIGENFLFCLSPCSTEQYLHIQTSILFPKMQAPPGLEHRFVAKHFIGQWQSTGSPVELFKNSAGPTWPVQSSAVIFLFQYPRGWFRYSKQIKVLPRFLQSY